MFSAYCHDCGGEVLLGPRRILLLQNTDRGVVLVFRCWEGHLGTWLAGEVAESPLPALV